MRGVLFDLDGTLVDTLADIVAAMNHVLRQAGFPTHDEAAYRGFIGWGAKTLVEKALPEAARGEAERHLAAFRARYLAHLVVETKPYPGVRALLTALEGRGVPLGVLSNKPHAMTERVVSQLFPAVPWKIMLGAREGVPKKPDPAGPRQALGALGVAASDCLYVGDTEVDVATARNAGMIAVGARWGFRGEVLAEAGADHVLEAPDELLALL